jgi:hypothetical protein
VKLKRQNACAICSGNIDTGIKANPTITEPDRHTTSTLAAGSRISSVVQTGDASIVCSIARVTWSSICSFQKYLQETLEWLMRIDQTAHQSGNTGSSMARIPILASEFDWGGAIEIHMTTDGTHLAYAQTR